jgi:hypothetical protein
MVRSWLMLSLIVTDVDELERRRRAPGSVQEGARDEGRVVYERWA